jgi:hypothetical protein
MPVDGDKICRSVMMPRLKEKATSDFVGFGVEPEVI